MLRRQPSDTAESRAGHRAAWLRSLLASAVTVAFWPFRFTLALLSRGGTLSLIGFAAAPFSVYLLRGLGWAVAAFALSCVLADAFVIGANDDEASAKRTQRPR